MKTTADVLRYIEEFMTNMQDRPDMYAANPEALEGQLWLLDDIRKRLLAPEADDFALHDVGYSRYLTLNGYGVANFCHRKRLGRKRRQSPQDKDLFFKLAGFWKGYMQSAQYSGPWPNAEQSAADN